MENFYITASILLLVISPLMAAPQSYGPPPSVSFGNFNRGNDFNKNHEGGFQSFRNSLSSISNSPGGNDPGVLGSNIPGPKVFRHISLFVAPQDSSDQQGVRTIRPQQGAPDKHVQIIFVRVPSRSSAQQTEIELPPQPEQKTLVYVLVKKPEEGSNNVKILGPPSTKPPPPEVYFIKYKDAGGGASNNGGAGGSFGTGGGALPVRSSSGSLSSNYGAP